MAQYIDKDALVAEIEKLQERYSTCPTRTNYEDGLKEGRLIGYEDALHKINTFEVKEVDLEKDVDKILEENDWNYDEIDFYQLAKHFFELGLKAQKQKRKYNMKSYTDLEQSKKLTEVVYTCDICPHKGNLMCCHNCPNF